MKKRLLSLLLAVVMLMGSAIGNVTAAGEVTEKVVINFSASNMETKNLLYGTQFFTNWKTGDGLNSVGADLSGTADNGAHKKMYLRATVTFTALEDGIDLSTVWTVMGFRLRGNGQAYEAEFYNIYPKDVTMVDGSFDVSIPLSAISPKNITWTDVRQMNIYCNVADPYKLSAQGDSTQLKWGISNARVVRDVVEGETDFDELADLIKTDIDKTKFTPETIAIFEKAVADGETVLANEEATQDEVDAAATAIATALKSLEYIVPLYTARLEALLDEELALEGYTEASVNAYQTALQAAENLLAGDYTADEVNAAVKALMTAKLGLASTDTTNVLANFSAIAGMYDNLLYGNTLNTNWKTGDGLSATNVAGGGVDVSGADANGNATDVFLKLSIAFTGITAEADGALGEVIDSIGIRMRSTAMGGERACQMLNFNTTSLVESSHGVYELCIPLRYFVKQNIDWTDVKELLVQATVKKDYFRTTADGVPAAGVSRDFFMTVGEAQLIRKEDSLQGDVDANTEVTANDALITLQIATKKIEGTAKENKAADTDKNGEVTANDALLVLQIATKKIEGEREMAESKKMVAFTFDDGPSEYTATFLDQLKERDAHVTFFNVGINSEKYPETLKRIIAEGHMLGNHGYEHKKGMSSMTEAEMHAEVDNCTAAIEEITGVRTNLLRAPWIAVEQRELDYAKEQGYRVIDYVGYIADYDQNNWGENVILNAHLDANGKPKIKDGEIILLHEVYQSVPRPGTQSLDACIALIDMLQADGYEIVNVNELLDARAGGGQAGARYSRVLDLQHGVN